MCLNPIRKLAIEEQHRQASLWAQPSISETDAMKDLAAITPNLATVPNPIMVGSQSPPTAIFSPQSQNLGMGQPTMENLSVLMVGPQSPPLTIIIHKIKIWEWASLPWKIYQCSWWVLNLLL